MAISQPIGFPSRIAPAHSDTHGTPSVRVYDKAANTQLKLIA
jgi:hypothetical protein